MADDSIELPNGATLIESPDIDLPDGAQLISGDQTSPDPNSQDYEIDVRKAMEMTKNFDLPFQHALKIATALKVKNERFNVQQFGQEAGGTIGAAPPKPKTWVLPTDDTVRANGYDSKARYVFDQYVARPLFGYTAGLAMGAFEPVWKLFQKFDDTLPEEAKTQSLQQFIGTAATEDTPFFADTMHGLAEFMGSYTTAKAMLPEAQGLLTDKPLWRMEAERFFTASSLPEVAKVIVGLEKPEQSIKNIVSTTVGGTVFGATAHIEASELSKLSLQSAIMYSQARLAGQTPEQAAIQGAIPWVFKATENARYQQAEEVRPESDIVTKETISSPAIMTKRGEIFQGENHKTIRQSNTQARSIGARAGFVTNTGRFVNREEGAEIAVKRKQAEPGITSLHSENLTNIPEPAIVPEPQPGGAANVQEVVRNISGGHLPGAVHDIWQRFLGYIGGLAGETFPHMTRANQKVGESAARYISARVEAPFRSKDITGQILETGADPHKVGAVLTEDNLRSIRKSYEDAGESEKAEAVHSLVGENGYFADEQAYQDALNDPVIRETIERYKEIFTPIMDPLYKTAQDIAPDEVLPTRGHQTGARINLKAVMPDSPARRGDTSSGRSAAGNLTATFKRKSPFARRAKGTGQDYDINLYNIIENTYARQLEMARYKLLIQDMVDNGLAVKGKPGEIHEGMTPFPVQRRIIFTEDDGTIKTIPQYESLYVKNEFASEFRSAVNVDQPLKGTVTRYVNRALNTAAITGLTDATAHTMNLTTAMLTRPGIGGDALREAIAATGGIGDIAVVTERMISKGISVARGDPEAVKQMADLARIGALRMPHSGGGIRSIGSRFLIYYDRLSRMVMDDGYQFLKRKGMVEDSETARREFVNQVGQYNRRAQGELMKALKDSGASPFLTAGKTFTTLGFRNILLRPGVPATSTANAAALSGLVAARWAGTIGTIMVTNYLITKSITGRPGTPTLSIDTGKDDKAGRPIVIPIGQIFGYSRALRVTGLRGTMEGLRHGLTLKQSVSDGLKDIANSQIGIVAGPPLRAAAGALTGGPAAIGFTRVYPAVPPGQMQIPSDALYALGYSNPITGAYLEGAHKSPGDWAAQTWNFVNRQLPGVTPRPGMLPAREEALPKIVSHSEVNTFVEYTAREAKKLPIEERVEYILKEIERVEDPVQRAEVMGDILRKGVFYP